MAPIRAEKLTHPLQNKAYMLVNLEFNKIPTSPISNIIN